MISQKLLDKLKIIIKEDYRKNLNQKELVEIADGLVNYFSLLVKIQAKERSKDKKLCLQKKK